jgi:3',5'-cyclic AMP phosphodiesterase CpdA
MLAAAASTAAAVLLVSCGSRHPLDAGPMLQDVGTNAVTVVWWSSRPGPGALALRAPDGEFRREPAQRTGSRFEARIDGLRPSTAYGYWVEIGGRDNLHIPGILRTAPLPGTPFSFLVFGDSGSGKAAQYRLAAVMARHQAELVLHTGDLVYRKGELRDYRRKFHRPYREILASAPFYPVLGNHDTHTDNGRPFLDTFSLPTNGPPSLGAERCYWFDYGDARFVAVDSTLPAKVLADAVAPWLKEVLLASPLAWKLVFFHEPPWAGAHRPPNAKARDILVPAIESGRADVVFCGHNHLYERTHPMREGRVSPTNGILYIVSGAGGKSLYEEQHGDDPHIAAYNDKKYSFTLVRSRAGRLDVSQISEDDQILDSVTLNKTLNHNNRPNHE